LEFAMLQGPEDEVPVPLTPEFAKPVDEPQLQIVISVSMILSVAIRSSASTPAWDLYGPLQLDLSDVGHLRGGRPDASAITKLALGPPSEAVLAVWQEVRQTARRINALCNRA